jgi:anaphase-promoting complex subunit 1
MVPKLEFAVRVQPLNTILPNDPGKISPEARNWAEFHNGVAAGLRISPLSQSIDSSWIAFNKPTELSPQHAGFLFGLGLNGHLKSMLTWHTFSYLTPKHDLTSVAVLLGLAAAHVGSGNKQVTKLLAVHTPALLPLPSVDLNIPLLIQAAGISGVGLLYLGTKNRHMAEVVLHEIGRRDLVQAEPSREHHEAYALSAALAFGMIMVGTNADISSLADMHLISTLRLFIHGDPPSLTKPSRPPFDVNVTAPAATMALGLMFLKTGRKDIAHILALPDTAMTLHYIQPSFLLLRTLGRSLILWHAIQSSREWVKAQLPSEIRDAVEQQGRKTINDSFELAYYHIVSGSCIAIGLKYAGTAQQEAYETLIHFFDHFTSVTEQSGEHLIINYHRPDVPHLARIFL